MGKKRLAQLMFIIVVVFSAMQAFAAQVQLAWDASTGEVDGYRIYYGTTQGSHPTRIEVGNVTTYTVTNLQEGVTYYFVARAYNQYGESGDSNEISWTAPVNDTTPPTIQITAPTAEETYDTNSNSVTLSGTASDNIQVSQVTWVNSAGGSGTASGTTSWTIQNISLVEGENQITVTAKDSSDNTATDTITINYTVPQGTYTKTFGDSADSDYTGTVQDTFLNINDEINATNVSLNTYTWPTDKPANAIVMKWDLFAIPAGAQIQSATLYLYMNQMEDGGGDSMYDISVHKIIKHNPDVAHCNGYTYDGTHNWTANTVCYNNIPLAQADIAPAEDTKSLDKSYGYKTWNLTNMVRDWIANPSSNFGLLLNSDSSASSGSNRFFASSEAPDPNERPKLVITYTVGGDTTPPGDVSNLQAVPGPAKVTFSWTNPTDSDFAGVMIRFRTDGTYPQNMNDGYAVPNGNDGKITGNPGANMSYEHNNLDPTKHYYYSFFTYDTSGNYSHTAHIDVQPLPTNHNPVITTFTVSPTSINNPYETATFTAAATDEDGDTLTYEINFGDGNSATGTTVTHAYTAAGQYTATLTVSDGNGGISTRELTVNVNDLPPAAPTGVQVE